MDAAVAGIVGVAVGSGITIGYAWFRDWREGKEKYRVMLYGKRLEVHQQAYYYSVQLLQSFDDYLSDLGLTKEFLPLYQEARDFYYSNSLYLDENSRKLFREALNAIIPCFEGLDDETVEDVSSRLIKAMRAVETGIGMKHLEETRPKQPKSKL